MLAAYTQLRLARWCVGIGGFPGGVATLPVGGLTPWRVRRGVLALIGRKVGIGNVYGFVAEAL